MIRPVDKLPDGRWAGSKGYRMRIRADIQEAMDKGIARFEFVGDYNYRTLGNTAREEADKMNYRLVQPHLRNSKYYRQISVYELKRIFPIAIITTKSETPGERRVYCEIEGLNDLRDNVLQRCENIMKIREDRKRMVEESMRKIGEIRVKKDGANDG